MTGDRLPATPELFAELDELIVLAGDQTLSDRQVVRLEELVVGNEEACLHYAAMMHVHAGLMRRFRSQNESDSPEPIESILARCPRIETSCPPLAPAAVHGFLDSAWQGLGSLTSNEYFTGYMVATVLFAIATVIGLNVYVSSPAPQQYVSRQGEAPRTPRRPNPHEAEQEKIVSVGRITGMVDCKWADTDDAPIHDRVILGAKYMLKSGLMEITYYTGARAILQGPCTYEVESADGGYLSLGKLTARVESRSRLPDGTSRSRLPSGTSLTDRDTSKSRPAGGTYFAVRTPTAVVTDLGTEFGVEVDKKGETFAHVFLGVVEVADAKGTGPVRLGANQSARVKTTGKGENPVVVVRGEGVKPGEFVRGVELAAKVKEIQEAPLRQFRQWQAFRDKLRRRDDLLAYYDFQRDQDDPRGENGCQIMRNRAKTGSKFDGQVWGTLRMGMAQGRCLGKQALQFGSQDDGVVINIPGEHNQMTLATWINLDEVPTDGRSLVMSDNVPPVICHWQIGLGGKIGGPAGARLFGESSLVLLRAQWSFVATVCDCATGKAVYYFNGEPCGDISLKKPVSPIAIGRATIGAWNHGNSNERMLPGRMDELMIFQSALSASEIRRLYEAVEPCVQGTGPATQRK